MKSAEAMASGGVELVKKIKIFFCALAVVVALLMATRGSSNGGQLRRTTPTPTDLEVPIS
jgi:hypothetical protein